MKQAQIVMVSLAVHLVVFILLALLTCTLQEKNYVTILAAAFAEESPPVEQVVELRKPEEATLADAGLGEGLTSKLMDGGPAEITALEVGYEDVEAKSRSQGRSLLSGAGASNTSVGAGHAPGNYAEFFGIRATGKKFVFIVDRSNSMRNDRKIAEAKEELLYALRRLSSDQTFYVLFFDFRFEKMKLAANQPPPDDLVPATTPNIQKVTSWVKRVDCDGGTDPSHAMEFALSLKPDAIYLLTDGEFHDHGRTMDILNSANREPNLENGPQPIVAVHTIGISGAGDQVLQKIADENRGTFRFVETRQ